MHLTTEWNINPMPTLSRHKPAQNERSRFQILLDGASQQVGFTHVTDADNTVRASLKKPAASVDHVSLREMDVPAFPARDGVRVHFPMAQEAGKRSKLSAALLNASRVADAGAVIITVPDAAPVQTVNGVMAFERASMRFDLIEAATFSAVTDGADAQESALPFFTAPIEVDETANLAFRVKLTRADRRAYEAGYLSDAALASVCLGLARAADKVLLDAILATAPDAFSLGAAAAQGFKFSELRALVGAAGSGAAVSQDGALRVSGVSAEFTADATDTVIGSFNRSAVAISERITLTAERANVRSDLNVTCWANMQALLPMPAAFWTVGG
ncbi:hypothetical protein GCM10010990_28160 [Croceicoccus mobilis]|uniref:Uncharacterized protein n=2 Tax=Croceicoccus mobilis TaxID=1703339 RepID=A0A916Z552_9SPHN|nr:hypothetical protein GCM10010990_28160 [Croceicoccus mobilis]